MVTGAHVGGFNSGNIGICLLGNLMKAKPTAAARQALTTVLGLLAKSGRLTPTAIATYVNPVSGATAKLPTIAGHQDWNKANPSAGSTDCPGDQLYPLLPQIRRDVAALLSTPELY